MQITQKALQQSRSHDQMLDYLFQNPIEDFEDLRQSAHQLTQEGFGLLHWVGRLFGISR